MAMYGAEDSEMIQESCIWWQGQTTPKLKRTERGERKMTPYTEADKAAVAILRAAYTESEASDTLYNARQYLQDRARYLRLRDLKVESRAAYLQSLGWPSTPWTDADHKRFTDASDRWDRAYSKEYRAER